MQSVPVNANLSKAEKYQELLLRINALIQTETDVTANLANICAALKEVFNWWWVGFYLVKGNQLVLGPFQGPVACTRINYGKGVCGTAWQQQKSQIVPDVEKFVGHIACSAASKSEIVIPVILAGKVIAVLDADSEFLNHFDETDRINLEMLVHKIAF